MPELSKGSSYQLPSLVFQPINPASYFERDVGTAVPDNTQAAKTMGEAAMKGIVAQTLTKLPELIYDGMKKGREIREEGDKMKLGQEIRDDYRAARAGQKPTLSDYRAASNGDVVSQYESPEDRAAKREALLYRYSHQPVDRTTYTPNPAIPAGPDTDPEPPAQQAPAYDFQDIPEDTSDDTETTDPSPEDKVSINSLESLQASPVNADGLPPVPENAVAQRTPDPGWYGTQLLAGAASTGDIVGGEGDAGATDPGVGEILGAPKAVPVAVPKAQPVTEAQPLLALPQGSRDPSLSSANNNALLNPSEGQPSLGSPIPRPKEVGQAKPIRKRTYPNFVDVTYDDGTPEGLKVRYPNQIKPGQAQYTVLPKGPKGAQVKQQPMNFKDTAEMQAWADKNGVEPQQIVSNPDGTVYAKTWKKAGTRGGEKMTEAQAKIKGSLDEMNGALAAIEGVKKYDPTGKYSSGDMALAGSPILNAAKTEFLGANPEAQQYWNAAKRFAIASLRNTSGASYKDSELNDEIAKYFPQSGDSPEVAKQKVKAREERVKSLASQLPGHMGETPLDAKKSDSGARVRVIGPAGQKGTMLESELASHPGWKRLD